MDELKFLAIENIFEEVRDEVVYIKMKYLLIQKYNGNHPSNKIVSAVDAEMFIHNRYNPEDFEKQLTWKYEYEILEESILKYGMKEPICVKPLLDMGDYHSPDYQMLDGSHRMVCIKHILLTSSQKRVS